VVAERAAAGVVERQRDRAVGAGRHRAALAAKEARGVASAVQEEEALFLAREPRGQRIAQSGAQHGLAARLQHRAAIDDLDGGQALRPDPRREDETRVLALLSVRE